MSSKYGYQIQYANFDFATTATHEVVAALATRRIRVVAMFVRTDDVVTIQFLSAATAIGGTMQMTDGDTISLPMNEYGWFQTGVAEALNISLSRAKQVSGWIGYFQV